MTRRDGGRVRAGDVSLWVESRGRGRPVVLLHGFTGSAESMRSTAAALGDGYRTHCVELIGHGRSDAPDDPRHYSMQSCVEQLLAVLDALELVRPHLVGYSMGGRVALSLCAARPQRVACALLVGASPGIADSRDREARARSDEALARRILAAGIEPFVDYWTALPLFASQRRLGPDALARARAQRLRNRPRGLAASLRGMGTGAMPPLQRDLAALPLPLCLVVGEEDAKFLALARELARIVPRAQVECLERAGHAAHLESPREFARVARRFFAAVDAADHSAPHRTAESSDPPSTTPYKPPQAPTTPRKPRQPSTTPRAEPGRRRAERIP